MKNFFVTGTDTGVGKTITAAVLLKALNAYYWKPIQSGLADEPSDQMQIAELTGLNEKHFFKSDYAFKASLSPHHAAALENKKIDLSFCKMPVNATPLIVEGAGGVFVPLNDHETLLDLMQKLSLPIIVVARGTLGTINHTLLTIEVLRQRNLTIFGVVFNGALNPANWDTIEKWGKVRILFHIPYFEKKADLTFWVEENQYTILRALS